MRNLKRIGLAWTWVLLFGTAAGEAAQHTVEALPGAVFSPQNLVIEAGDTVTWVNKGGLHNVVANDLSFRCANGCDGAGGNGTPSSAAWSFSLTFNDPDFIPYICEVHVSVGMVGSITVQDPAPQPGTLSFSSASQSAEVGEGDGFVTLTVQRTGGTDGAVSVDYATADSSAVAGLDYAAAAGTLDWADGDGVAKTFQVQITDDDELEIDETFQVLLSSPGGGAGIGVGTAAVTILDNELIFTDGFESGNFSAWSAVVGTVTP